MSDAIAAAFYDKTIEIVKRVTVKDREGGITSKGYEVISSFEGNVSFSNCKKIQEEYGLDYQFDISITSHVDTSVALNDLIQYEGIVYDVVEILPTDSHILIVAKKWRQ
jgi:hypothetical protein